MHPRRAARCRGGGGGTYGENTYNRKQQQTRRVNPLNTVTLNMYPKFTGRNTQFVGEPVDAAAAAEAPIEKKRRVREPSLRVHPSG